MTGIVLVALGQIFAETSISFGKSEVKKKEESIYAFGFLQAIWSAIFLLVIGIFIRDNFVFTLASLPTFLSRAGIEMVLVFISIHAIIEAERSTFAFIHTLTIPLLLVVDTYLGYSFTTKQLLGISAIVIAFIFLLLNHGLSKKGKILSLASSVMAVGTISLYKYNITHFNSVEAEQALMLIIVILTLAIAAWFKNRENLFKEILEPKFFLQSASSGVAHVLVSFAYLFAQASIIVTAKRSFEILLSLVSGKSYFHEKHILIKIVASAIIVVGLILLTT